MVGRRKPAPTGPPEGGPNDSVRLKADSTGDVRRMQAGVRNQPASGNKHRWGPALGGPMQLQWELED